MSENAPKKGLLLVISGPSGSGKGTVLSQVFSNNPNIFYSISATTRSPRPGDVDGEQYYFLTKEQFEQKIKDGGMLEYAEYCGNYYGTPKAPVEEKCANGFDVVLEIEVQGAIQVKKLNPDCVTIFITPPSLEVLEKRLRGRGTEPENVIESRLETARKEMALKDKYDYIVVNDKVSDAASKIQSIIVAEKLKAGRN